MYTELFSPFYLFQLPASVALLAEPRYVLPGYGDQRVWVRRLGWPDHCVRLYIAAYALRLNPRSGTEGLMVSSLTCDHWLMLGSETLSIGRCLNHS